MKSLENNVTAENNQEHKHIGTLVLWILGWIFLFPITAMVLIWRKKNTWNVATKMLATLALWVLVIFASVLATVYKTVQNYKHSQVTVENTRPNLLNKAKNFDKNTGDWETDVVEKCKITEDEELRNCIKLSNTLCSNYRNEVMINMFSMDKYEVFQFDEDNILVVTDGLQTGIHDSTAIVLFAYDPSQKLNGDIDYELHYCNIDGYEYYDDGTYDNEWNEYQVMKNLKG